MVSQYMFNGLFLNPAYAGSHPYVSGSVLHREQWTNMAGAPSTSMLATTVRCGTTAWASGFPSYMTDAGMSTWTSPGHYAYSIRTGETSRLASACARGSVYSANISELVYWDANDDVYQQRIKNAMVGKFGFGVFARRTDLCGARCPPSMLSMAK